MEPPAPSSLSAGEIDSLDYLLWMLHWTATLRHPDSRSWSARLFYLRFAAAMAAFLYYYCGHAILTWRAGFADVDHVTMALSLLDTAGMWIFRRGHIAKHERDFHRLALQVRDDFGEFMTPRDVPEVQRRSRTMRRFVLSYLSLAVCNITLWLMSPIRGNGLPLEVILPFDTAQPVGWAVGWLFCAYIGVDSVVINMMADSFNISLMSQLRTQLIVLKKNVTELANDGRSKDLSPLQTPMKESERMSKQETGNHCQKTNSLLVDIKVKGIQQSYGVCNSESVHCRLQKIILHHQTIIRNVDSLQQCLGGILLAQSLALGAAICILLFQVALSAEGARETGKVCGYLCAMFTELSVYCWFGDQLMSESVEVALAAYDAVTSLQECPLSIKRSLLLLMHRAQRPLCITAAGFYPFSRESFVSILNVSYSFFAILRNFKEEK